jgi:hypothetical protein
MINIGSLILGMLFGFLAQVATFFQLQGSLRFDWFKNHYWVIVLMGIPISMMFMFSVKHMVTAFDGEIWPSRLIGFSIGAIVFTMLSWSVFGEILTLKTLACLALALGILLIQFFWK